IATGLGDFSVVFYGKLYGLNNSNNFITGSIPAQPNEFIISYNDVGAYLQRGWQIRIADQNVSFPSNVSMSDLNWHHIAITRTGDKASLYIDGKKIGDDITVNPKVLNIASGGFILGQDQDCVGGCFQTEQNWNGEVDELLIYDRALSASEIFNLFE